MSADNHGQRNSITVRPVFFNDDICEKAKLGLIRTTAEAIELKSTNYGLNPIPFEKDGFQQKYFFMVVT